MPQKNLAVSLDFTLPVHSAMEVELVKHKTLQSISATLSFLSIASLSIQACFFSTAASKELQLWGVKL